MSKRNCVELIAKRIKEAPLNKVQNSEHYPKLDDTRTCQMPLPVFPFPPARQAASSPRLPRIHRLAQP